MKTEPVSDAAVGTNDAAERPARPAWRDAFCTDFPTKIQLQTINRCNYACTMCPYPETAKTRSKSVMSEQLILKIIAELEARRRSAKLCLMLQNEPLLDSRFVDFARLAQACDRIDGIATVTNGSCLTTNLLDELTALSKLSLTVSINSTSPARYLKIHGRDRWDQVTHVLSSWTGPRERVVVSCVVSTDEPTLGAAFEDQWRQLGYRVRLVPLNGRRGTLVAENRLHLPEYGSSHCHYPVDTLAVRADGKVLMCCQDWEHDQLHGDLLQDSIYDIWNAPSLSRIREASLAGRIDQVSRCKGCDYPLRSASRAALEQQLGGEPPDTANAGASTIHQSFLRLADGTRHPVAVRSVNRDGTAVVVSFSPLSAPVEEIEAQLAREHGYTSAVGCRATATPVPIKTVGADGVSALRVRIASDDPRSVYWRWYHDDWRTPDA